MPAKFKALPKAKRAALANAKEALRHFTGELSSPILVPGTDGKYSLSTTTLKPEIAKQIPKADIPQRRLDVRFVPKADSCTAAKRPLAGPRFLCVRPHEPAALQALGRPDCV
jgi:hypothetical protein